MIRTMLRYLATAARWVPTIIGGAGLVAGCGMLDVSDPTRIEEADISNSTGADLLRKDALRALAEASSVATFVSGVLADEFFVDVSPDPFWAFLQDFHNAALDQRASQQYEDLAFRRSPNAYAAWHEVRRAASVALPRLQAYAPVSTREAYRGQMFAVRGLATLRLAEDFCPGFPLHEVVDDRVVYGAPRTTVAVFERALADFDSAVVMAVDSMQFLHLAQIGRARTLLGLGRFEEAAAAVSAVPTDYVWNAELGGRRDLVFTLGSGLFTQYGVADREGGTGLDFVSTDDPRVATTLLGLAYDGVTEIHAIGKYPSQTAPMVAVSGIEARLIEAEAALRANPDALSWLAMLNDLRAADGRPELTPLADPGTDAARVDLLFRERAFWLFATGHRLADLRRLVEHYGRDPETVFPTGAYRSGDLYGTATSVPFPAATEAAYSPAVTGCTRR